MKKYSIIILLLLLIKCANSQELGVKFGTNLTKETPLNTPINIGGYLTNSINCKYDFLVSYDFSKRTRQYKELDLEEQFKGHNVTLGILYVYNFNEKFKFKTGLSMGYCYHYTLSRGIFNRWHSQFYAHYFGGGIIAGIEYKNFCSFPIGLELLFVPSYYYNISQTFEPSPNHWDEKKNYFEYINLSFGIKYRFNRNK